MDKNSDINNSGDTELKVENAILEKLYNNYNQDILQTSREEFQISFAEVAGSSNFDIALNNLIVNGLVTRIGIDEYRITDNGISEYQSRIQ